MVEKILLKVSIMDRTDKLKVGSQRRMLLLMVQKIPLKVSIVGRRENLKEGRSADIITEVTANMKVNVDSFTQVQFARNMSTLDTAAKKNVMKDISKNANGLKAGTVADAQIVNICTTRLMIALNVRAVWILGKTGRVSKSI